MHFDIVRKTIVDGIRVVTSRKRLKQLLGIPLYRNALYLLTYNLAVPATGFVFWAIAAKFYAVEDIGVASAILSVMGLVWVISNLGPGAGLVRYLANSGQNDNRMINSCFTLTSLASIIISGLFLAGLNVWSPALLFLRQSPIYLSAFVAFTVANTLSRMVDWSFIAQRRAGFTLGRGLIFAFLRLPLLIPLAAFFQSFGIFASWGLSLIVSLVIAIFFFLQRTHSSYRPFPTISQGVVNEIGGFSFANYISDLFWFLPTFALPITVLNLVGTEANAYFYISWMVGNVLASAPVAASSSLFAEGSHSEQKLASDVMRSLKLTFLVLVPSIILVIAIADKLLLLFGSQYSQSGTTLLRILALSALPLAINYIYLSMKRVQKKIAALLKLSVFVGITTLGLSYWLLPSIGINGAGLAWLGSQGIAAVFAVGSFVKQLSLRKKR